MCSRENTGRWKGDCHVRATRAVELAAVNSEGALRTQNGDDYGFCTGYKGPAVDDNMFFQHGRFRPHTAREKASCCTPRYRTVESPKRGGGH